MQDYFNLNAISKTGQIAVKWYEKLGNVSAL